MKKKNNRTGIKHISLQSLISKDKVALMVFGIAMFITAMHVGNPRWNIRSFTDSLVPDPTRAPRNTPTPKVLPTPPPQTLSESKVNFNSRNIYGDNGEYFIHELGFAQKDGDVVELIPDVKKIADGKFSLGVKIQRNNSIVYVRHVSDNSFITHTAQERASIVGFNADQFTGDKVYRRAARNSDLDYSYVTGFAEPCEWNSPETGTCDSNMAVFKTGAVLFINCDSDEANVKTCDDIVKSFSFTEVAVK